MIEPGALFRKTSFDGAPTDVPIFAPLPAAVEPFTPATDALFLPQASDAQSGDADRPSDAGQASANYVAYGTKWGPSQTLGTTGGNVTWSLAGAGYSNASGMTFFTGTTVALASIFPFDYRSVLTQALAAWSSVADISFTEVTDGGGNFGTGLTGNIRIGGGYIDGSPSSNNTLGTAFYPSSGGAPQNSAISGDTIFDSADTWTASRLLTIATHEFGHALGLSHTTVDGSIMEASVNAGVTTPQADDIAGIRAIYGAAPIVAGAIAVNDVSITEGNSGTQVATFTVSRSGGAAAFSVQYATSNGTALSGSDYAGVSGTLSFGAGVNSQTIQVVINGDVTVEPNETFTLNLSAGTNGVTISDSQGIGTIINDDAATPTDDYADSLGDGSAPYGSVAINGSSTGTLEGAGDRDWFRVQLSAGTTYKISLLGGSSGAGTLEDPYLRVRNSSGTLVTENDDNNPTLDSILTFAAPATGIYYIEAGAFNDNGSGSYRAAVSTAASASISQDFNNDQFSDLLFRNGSGTFTEWQSIGNGFTPNVVVNSTVGTAWRTEGTFDFSGDGRADLLFRNDASGQFTIWNSTGNGFAPNSFISSGVDGSWRVGALGDFNGDGLGDIIWRNASGVFTEWQSTNSGFVQNVYVQSAVDPSWRLVAAADFSGDGRTDLLFRNTNGTFTEWQSTGNGFTPNVYVQSNVGTDWRVMGTGDFNGDGRADLLFRNAAGTFTEWQSTGSGFTPNVYIQSGVDTNWSLAQASDFNGDGRDDLLFRSTSGVFTEWQSTGNSFTPNVVVNSTVAPDWSIVTPHQYDLV